MQNMHAEMRNARNLETKHDYRLYNDYRHIELTDG